MSRARPRIPANSALVFDYEILAVKPRSFVKLMRERIAAGTADEAMAKAKATPNLKDYTVSASSIQAAANAPNRKEPRAVRYSYGTRPTIGMVTPIIKASNQWLFLREFDAHGGKDRGNDCTVDFERVRENQETLLHQLQENDQQAAADSINEDLAFHW